MQKHPMPTQCPVTGEALEVTKLECPTSGIVIEGRFEPNEFALLAGEHLENLRMFIKVRGNLKEAERIMGVSYPTVRLRMENMLKALGYEVEAEPENKTNRAEILELLEKGDITVNEATKRLQGLKK